LTFSSVPVRQNAEPAIVATIRKMKIETAQARPKSFPFPASNASLYV
jgi:hypothetical protein